MPVSLALAEANTMKCWICGNPADTREHIIKQSDIRRLFGRGPYQKGNRLKRMDQNQTRKLIQSEDSVHIKYQKNLCKHCNSARSQPWDKAYDEFMEYILRNESELKRTRKVGFKDVVHSDTGRFTTSLYSYFVKAFGCQLQENGQTPPLELSEFLLDKGDNTNLLITFAIYESMPKNSASPMVQIHPLEGDVENVTKKPLNYNWAVSIEWFTIIFWFNKVPAVELGSPFSGKTGNIDIGSYKERENS